VVEVILLLVFGIRKKKEREARGRKKKGKRSDISNKKLQLEYRKKC